MPGITRIKLKIFILLFFPTALQDFKFGVVAAYPDRQVVQLGFNIIKPFIMFLELFVGLFITLKEGIQLFAVIVFYPDNISFISFL